MSTEINKMIQNILDSIHFIVEKRVEKLEKEQTIVAEITSTLDSTTNKYKIKYRDMEYDAYSLKDSVYSTGDKVIVLIPDGNFSNKKVILMKNGKDAELLFGESSTSGDPTKNGFENTTSSRIDFDESTRTLTISPNNSTKFNIYVDGVKYEKGIETYTIPDVSAIYRVFYNKSDQKISSRTDTFYPDTDIPIAYIGWDSTGNGSGSYNLFLIDERHTIAITPETRDQLHQNGTIYATGFDIDKVTGVPKVQLTPGSFTNEDLKISILDSSTSGSVDYAQELTNLTTPLFYLKGNNWVSRGSNSDTLYFTSSGIPHYNQKVGSSWQMTPVTSGNYFVTYIAAMNSKTNPIICFPGQSIATTAAAVDIANKWSEFTKSANGLPYLDIRPLYKIVFNYSTVSGVNIAAIKDLRRATEQTAYMTEAFDSAISDAKSVALTSNSQIFAVKTNGTTDSPDIVFTAILKHFDVAPTVTFTTKDGTATLTNISSTSATLSFANFATSTVTVVATAIDEYGGVYKDEMTVVKLNEGSDAITILLSNETHALPLDSAGLTTTSTFNGSSTNIYVYHGATLLTFNGAGATYPAAGKWNATVVGTGLSPKAVTSWTLNGDGSINTGDLNESTITTTNPSVKYTFYITKSNGGQVSPAPFKTQTFTTTKDGQAGDSSRAVNLSTTKQVFSYTSDGSLITSPDQSSTITATARNTKNGAFLTYRFDRTNSSGTTITGTYSSSSSYTFNPATLATTYSSMPQTITVYMKEDEVEVASDTLTLYGVQPGSHAMLAILTNETQSLSADATGVVTDYAGSGTRLYVLEGATKLDYAGEGTSVTTNGTWKVSIASSNITPGTRSNVVESSKTVGVLLGNASSFSSVSDTATITFSIVGKTSEGRSFTLEKVQTFSKSKAGAKGDTGDIGPAGASGTSYILELSTENIVYNGTSYYANGSVVSSIIATAYSQTGTSPKAPLSGKTINFYKNTNSIADGTGTTDANGQVSFSLGSAVSTLQQIKVQLKDGSTELTIKLVGVTYVPKFVTDWDGSKTEVGTDYIVSPNIFAGGGGTIPTGILMGKDISYTNNNGVTTSASGIVALNSGAKTFELKTDGSLTIGSVTGKQLKFSSSGGLLEVPEITADKITGGMLTTNTGAWTSTSYSSYSGSYINIYKDYLTVRGDSVDKVRLGIDTAYTTDSYAYASPSLVLGSGTNQLIIKKWLAGTLSGGVERAMISFGNSSIDFFTNGTVEISGDLSVTGTINGGAGGSVDLTSVASNINPDATGTRSIGTSTLRWNSIYATNLNLSNDLAVGNTVNSNLIPGTSATYSLGTSTLKWNNVYANNFYGNGSNLTGVIARFG